MGINLDDTAVSVHGFRSQDLPVQAQACADTVFAVQNGQQTYRACYGGLSSDVKQRALDLMHVGTMAFADSWQYSLSGHEHGNYVNAQPTLKYGQTSDGSTQKIGTLSAGVAGADGFKIGQYIVADIYCPMLQPPIPDEPEYGTVRFMYSKIGMPQIDSAYIRSSDFDGWVYPDGSQFDIDPSQFAKSGNKFVTRDSNPFIYGQTLRVPNLYGQFVKLNPFTEYSSAEGVRTCRFEQVPQHVALAAHEHPINSLDASVRLVPDIENSHFDSTDNWQNLGKDTVHYGGGAGTAQSPKTYNATINMKSCRLELKTTQADPPAGVVHPSYWAVPVMIYVGGRKKEYDKIYLS